MSSGMIAAVAPGATFYVVDEGTIASDPFTVQSPPCPSHFANLLQLLGPGFLLMPCIRLQSHLTGFLMLRLTASSSATAQTLLEAVHQGNLAAVQQLCASGLDINAARSPLPPMTPPLIEAVCARRRDIIDLLLDRSASLQARDVAYGAHLFASLFAPSLAPSFAYHPLAYRSEDQSHAWPVLTPAAPAAMKGSPALSLHTR